MSTILASFVQQTVSVFTTEGRLFQGVLLSFDQSANLVLEKCEEKVVEQGRLISLPMGALVIRGDSIAMAGELDLEAQDSSAVGKMLSSMVR